MINPILGYIGHELWWYSEDKHRGGMEEGEVGAASPAPGIRPRPKPLCFAMRVDSFHRCVHRERQPAAPLDLRRPPDRERSGGRLFALAEVPPTTRNDPSIHRLEGRPADKVHISLEDQMFLGDLDVIERVVPAFPGPSPGRRRGPAVDQPGC